jgi:hypothetical protein
MSNLLKRLSTSILTKPVKVQVRNSSIIGNVSNSNNKSRLVKRSISTSNVYKSENPSKIIELNNIEKKIDVKEEFDEKIKNNEIIDNVDDIIIDKISRSILSQQDVEDILVNAKAVCFDVDSTIIREEGVDILASHCNVTDEVAALTEK